MQNFTEGLFMDYESNKLQFHKIQRSQREKEAFLFICLQALEAKERQFEESVKEFELREKKSDSI